VNSLAIDPRNPFDNFEVENLIKLVKICADDFSDYDWLRLLGKFRIFINEEVRSDNDFSTCKPCPRWFKLIDILYTFPFGAWSH